MTARPSHGRPIARALVAALLLPFVLLSALAAGTMPVRGADGVELVICTGDAVVTVTGPVDRAPPDEAPAPRHEACPWDKAAAPIVPVAPPVLASPPLILRAAVWTAPARVAHVRRPTHRVANRGPPRLR